MWNNFGLRSNETILNFIIPSNSNKTVPLPIQNISKSKSIQNTNLKQHYLHSERFCPRIVIFTCPNFSVDDNIIGWLFIQCQNNQSKCQSSTNKKSPCTQKKTKDLCAFWWSLIGFVNYKRLITRTHDDVQIVNPSVSESIQRRKKDRNL